MRADAGAQTRRDQCRAQCRQRARRDLRLGLGDCPRSAASCPCTTTAVVVAAASREMRKINRARLSSGGGCNNSLVGALPLHTSESVSFIPRVTAPVFSARPLLKRTQVRVAELDPRRLHWQLDCLGVFVVQR